MLEPSRVTDTYTKNVFTFLGEHAVRSTIAGDSVTPIYNLKASDIDVLSQMQFDEVQARYITHGGQLETPAEAYRGMLQKIAGDTLMNPKNGVGMLNDPAIYTHSDIPLMIGPMDGTNIYANGGLPTTIIDKKARAMVLQGATFKTYDEKFWDNNKLSMLEEAAELTGFNSCIADAICDAFVYGGSLCYPVFKGESPTSFLRPIDKLNLDKGCIDRWVEVDRWNVTIVPSYDVTAADYLNPQTIYIPIGAVEIDTSRMCLLKARPVPYWAALYNIGWAPSDFTGWLRSYYGYQITAQSIPVMAQQMSLLLYKMPLDGLNATVGPEGVKKLMQLNEDKMAEWSALSPKAVNMVGDVEVVDRTYSGFDQFVGAMKSDLAAQCGIPEPSLWHTPNKGFGDNTQESLLKQSETLHLLQRHVEREVKNATRILVGHTFGAKSKEYANYNKVWMSFDKPVISTEKDMAEAGARFAASVSSFAQAGVSPDTAIKLTMSFFPSIKITEDLISAAKKSYDQEMDRQERMGQQKLKMGAGQGNVMASSSGKNTGAHTK